MREILCLLVKGLIAFKLSGESADGKFQLDFNNNSPLAKYLLKNDDVFLISEGVKLSASNGGLIPNGNMIKTSGSDKLGSYKMFTNMWQYQVSNKTDLAEFATVTKLYNGQDLAIFEQHFFDEVDVAPDTFIEKGTACSGFPVFDVNNENDDIGFTTPARYTILIK